MYIPGPVNGKYTFQKPAQTFPTIQLLCDEENKNFENKRAGRHRSLMLCRIAGTFTIRTIFGMLQLGK